MMHVEAARRAIDNPSEFFKIIEEHFPKKDKDLECLTRIGRDTPSFDDIRLHAKTAALNPNRDYWLRPVYHMFDIGFYHMISYYDSGLLTSFFERLHKAYARTQSPAVVTIAVNTIDFCLKFDNSTFLHELRCAVFINLDFAEIAPTLLATPRLFPDEWLRSNFLLSRIHHDFHFLYHGLRRDKILLDLFCKTTAYCIDSLAHERYITDRFWTVCMWTAKQINNEVASLATELDSTTIDIVYRSLPFLTHETRTLHMNILCCGGLYLNNSRILREFLTDPYVLATVKADWIKAINPWIIDTEAGKTDCNDPDERDPWDEWIRILTPQFIRYTPEKKLVPLLLRLAKAPLEQGFQSLITCYFTAHQITDKTLGLLLCKVKDPQFRFLIKFFSKELQQCELPALIEKLSLLSNWQSAALEAP